MEARRSMLFNGINNGLVPDDVPLAELPMHLEDAPLTSPAFDMYKLDAPMAVQGGAPAGGGPGTAIPDYLQGRRACLIW